MVQDSERISERSVVGSMDLEENVRHQSVDDEFSVIGPESLGNQSRETPFIKVASSNLLENMHRSISGFGHSGDDLVRVEAAAQKHSNGERACQVRRYDFSESPSKFGGCLRERNCALWTIAEVTVALHRYLRYLDESNPEPMAGLKSRMSLNDVHGAEL